MKIVKTARANSAGHTKGNCVANGMNSSEVTLKLVRVLKNTIAIGAINLCITFSSIAEGVDRILKNVKHGTMVVRPKPRDEVPPRFKVLQRGRH